MTAIELIDGRIERYRVLIEELTAVRAKLATEPARPVPATVITVAPEAPRPGKGEPAARDRQPARGRAERTPNATKGASSQEKIVSAMRAAGRALTCAEVAKAASVSYATAYAVLTTQDRFAKTPSGKFELTPAGIESEAPEPATS